MKFVPEFLLAFHGLTVVCSLLQTGGTMVTAGRIGWGHGVGPFLMTLLTLNIVLICRVAHERDIANGRS